MYTILEQACAHVVHVLRSATLHLCIMRLLYMLLMCMQRTALQTAITRMSVCCTFTCVQYSFVSSLYYVTNAL
jgi:hypothetical protein